MGDRKQTGTGTLEILTKALCIGGTMTVPGVSGGSMAMLLGIYHKLIAAVSGFFQKPKESFFFLARFLFGAALGMVIFSGLITRMLAAPFGMALRFFFLGAVAGGIPMIYREAGVKKPEMEAFLYPLLGIMAVVLLKFLPTGLFAPGNGDFGGWQGMLIQFSGGILIAVGLVLPGISVSQLLYMLGIYEGIMGHISRLQLLPLLPLGAGVTAGTFLTARLLEQLLERHARAGWLLIFGFMLASLPELFPGLPEVREVPVCFLAAVLGFFLLFLIGKTSPAETV